MLGVIAKTAITLIGYGAGCGLMNYGATSFAIKATDKKFDKEIAEHPEYTDDEQKALYNEILEDKRRTANITTSVLAVGAGIGATCYLNSVLKPDQYDVGVTEAETVVFEDGGTVEITTF